MLTITAVTVNNVDSTNSVQAPAGKDIFVPITSTDDGGDSISYSVSSSNSSVITVTPVGGDTYLTLNVSGTDSTNTPYTGTLTFKLFDTLTPATVNTIETLVNAGDYTNTTFARVLNSLGNIIVAQGGMTSSGAQNNTGQEFPDEFNSQLTFDSPGMLAWANGGPDTNDVEFFVGGVDEPGSTTPLTQSDLTPTRSLDYRYTIFGQLTGGFDTFNKIMNSTVTTNPNNTSETSLPVPLINISSASITTDNTDTVLDISNTATAGASSTISITATEANGAVAQQAFNVNVVANTVTDPAFLGPFRSWSAPRSTRPSPLRCHPSIRTTRRFRIRLSTRRQALPRPTSRLAPSIWLPAR